MTDDRGPIFIGGLSHSGKTQVRMVLGAHPELSMTRRSRMWDRYYGRFGDLRRARNLDRCLAAMLASEGVRALDPDPERIRREFATGEQTYPRLFGLFHRHHAERLGRRRWGDQLGFVERFADPIFAAFPSARMIHMIRDPRSPSAVGVDRRARPGRIGWETARWLRSADLAESNRRSYEGRYRVIRYESLVARPEETLAELCDFLEETWVPEMAAVLGTVRFDAAPAGSAPGTSSTARAAFIDAYARRGLLALGYPVDRPMRSRARGAAPLVDRALNRAAMAAWQMIGERPIPQRVGG